MTNVNTRKRPTQSGSWTSQLASMLGGRGELPRAKTILVPLFGSSMDEKALQVAGAVAKDSGGRVYVLYIIEVPQASPLDAPMDSYVQTAEGVLGDVEEHWPYLKTTLATELLQARQAGPAIVTESIERGADLVIMGIDHQRRYGDYDLGAATAYVLQHAPSSVWIMREPIGQTGT